MSIYDEIEIEDMDFDEQSRTFFYPCPCGDKFQITLVINMVDNESLGINSFKRNYCLMSKLLTINQSDL
jgi:hypothetical protein